MVVEDILIGDSSVIVQTESEEYRLDRTSDDKVSSDKMELPVGVVDALEKEGFSVNSDTFPKTITNYIHSEATAYDREQMGEELGSPMDHSLVTKITGVGYEIELTIRLEDKDTAQITHFDGVELVEPKEIP